MLPARWGSPQEGRAAQSPAAPRARPVATVHSRLVATVPRNCYVWRRVSFRLCALLRCSRPFAEEVPTSAPTPRRGLPPRELLWLLTVGACRQVSGGASGSPCPRPCPGSRGGRATARGYPPHAAWVAPAPGTLTHRATEAPRLEKTPKIIQSDHQPNTAEPTAKPRPVPKHPSERHRLQLPGSWWALGGPSLCIRGLTTYRCPGRARSPAGASNQANTQFAALG